MIDVVGYDGMYGIERHYLDFVSAQCRSKLFSF